MPAASVLVWKLLAGLAVLLHLPCWPWSLGKWDPVSGYSPGTEQYVGSRKTLRAPCNQSVPAGGKRMTATSSCEQAARPPNCTCTSSTRTAEKAGRPNSRGLQKSATASSSTVFCQEKSVPRPSSWLYSVSHQLLLREGDLEQSLLIDKHSKDGDANSPRAALLSPPAVPRYAHLHPPHRAGQVYPALPDHCSRGRRGESAANGFVCLCAAGRESLHLILFPFPFIGAVECIG